MARRAKSIHLHLLDGNKNRYTKKEIEHRKAAEAALNPGADKVAPPKWLCREGKKEFRFLADQLKQINLISNTDVHMLALYCDAYIEYLKCRQIVEQEGLMVEYTNKAAETNKVPHPLLTKKKAAFEIMAKVAGEFGFTPGSKAKIAIPKKEEKPKTPFEEKFGDV